VKPSGSSGYSSVEATLPSQSSSRFNVSLCFTISENIRTIGPFFIIN
jgi:hypothetical protein